MSPIEAMADAIMTFEGWHRGSHSWRNRNPGNLRPTLVTQPADSAGYRTFLSLSDGWIALVMDLQAKIGGSHGLTPASTLLNLLSIYAPVGDSNNPGAYAKFVAAHLTYCLGRDITPASTLDDIFNLSTGVG